MIALLSIFLLVVLSAMLFLKLSRPFSPVFLFSLFFLVGVLFRWWYLLYVGEGGLVDVVVEGHERDVLLEQGVIHLSFALLAIFLGYLVFGVKRFSFGFSTRLFVLLPRARSQALLLAGGVWVASCLFFYIGAYDVGLMQFVTDLQGRAIGVMRGRGYLSILVDFTVVASVALYAYSVIYSRSIVIDLFVIATIILVMVGLMLLGGRGMLVQYLLSLLLVRLLGRGHDGKSLEASVRQWSYAIVLGVFSSIAIVVGLAARVAAQQGLEMAAVLEDQVESVVRALTSTIPILDSYVISMLFVARHGHDYGSHFLDYFTRFIPRAWWAEKPDLLGIQIRESFWGDTVTGIPPTYFGEFYISWGLIGVLIAGFVFGGMLRYAYKVERTILNNPGLLTAYAVLLPLVLFTLIRSGLEVAYMRILIYLVLIVMLNFLGFGGSRVTMVHHGRG
ncbi:O-antigen polymerase [Thioalkalivibrio sulfidiphilus]|uniref:O-antigen polymerase n=1 Tax=Thioalkalivibrio sulfidiphilus TaxID=1033854 RepID=UPI003BB1FA85